MRLLRFADLYKQQKNKTVVTIGNFDGMHLGHQSVLTKVTEAAHKAGLHSVAVFFEPQPKEFFLSDKAPGRITPFRDKMIEFKKLGLDLVLCLRFDRKLSQLTAEAFVKRILIDGLNASHVVIGDDFRFGADRQGNRELLISLGKKYGFTVESSASYIQDDLRISSSHIRKLLALGAFDQAAKLLGHRYSLSGRIHHGLENGRKLGFPTINIPVPIKVAVSGVYVVKVKIGEHHHYGVANIGVRPTVCGRMRLLETFIFDFDCDLYGQYVGIEFLKHIRDEKKFSDFNALSTQIAEDKAKALKWLEQVYMAHE
ncbi:MAG: bifunctional riboflavin kinase/FAD synthetase [Francisellaceae bacterium]